MAAYELTRPLSDAELAEAHAVADAMMAPAGEGLVLAELSRLRAMTVSREAGEDLTLIFSAYADELGAYPADVVRAVLRGWRGKFWPAWSELASELDRLVTPRRALRTALNRGYCAPKPSPDWRRPDDDEIAAIEAKLIAAGFSRGMARHRADAAMPRMTAADREVMASELARWRERWASVAARAAAE